MLLLAKGMKMETMIRRKIKSKQKKQELGKREEKSLWRRTNQQQKTLL